MSTNVRRKLHFDDPRAFANRTSGAVYFVFGLLGTDAAIRGPALVATLGVLGMSEPTARWTILRMRQGGRIDSRRRGRVVEYTLTAASRDLLADVAGRLTGRTPSWDGRFRGLLFSVPERHRAYRDSLRGLAMYHGFGSLRPGLLITPDASRFSRIEAILALAPKESRMLRVELEFAGADARTAAAEAWPLDLLARADAKDADRMRRAAARLTRSRPRGAAALRSLWNEIVPFSERLAQDPDLPREVLPAQWPRDAALQSNNEVIAAVGGEAAAYLSQTLKDQKPGHT